MHIFIELFYFVPLNFLDASLYLYDFLPHTHIYLLYLYMRVNVILTGSLYQLLRLPKNATTFSSSNRQAEI